MTSRIDQYATNETRKKGDTFYAQDIIFSVDMETEKFISVTTILTVITSGIENGTNITCLTYRGGDQMVSSSVLYFAGNYLKIGNFDSYSYAFRSPSLEKNISDIMPREEHSSTRARRYV